MMEVTAVLTDNVPNHELANNKTSLSFCNCCVRELLLTVSNLHSRPKLLCDRQNRSCLA